MEGSFDRQRLVDLDGFIRRWSTAVAVRQIVEQLRRPGDGQGHRQELCPGGPVEHGQERKRGGPVRLAKGTDSKLRRKTARLPAAIKMPIAPLPQREKDTPVPQRLDDLPGCQNRDAKSQAGRIDHAVHLSFVAWSITVADTARAAPTTTNGNQPKIGMNSRPVPMAAAVGTGGSWLRPLPTFMIILSFFLAGMTSPRSDLGREAVDP